MPQETKQQQQDQVEPRSAIVVATRACLSSSGSESMSSCTVMTSLGVAIRLARTCGSSAVEDKRAHISAKSMTVQSRVLFEQNRATLMSNVLVAQVSIPSSVPASTKTPEVVSTLRTPRCLQLNRLHL